MCICNVIVSNVRGKLYLPFARDCSIFVLLSASCVLLFCIKNTSFKNATVNRLAQSTFAIYIMEEFIRRVLAISLGLFVENNERMFENILILSVFTLAFGILFAELVQFSIDKLEEKLLKSKYLLGKKLINLCVNKVSSITITHTSKRNNVDTKV